MYDIDINPNLEIDFVLECSTTGKAWLHDKKIWKKNCKNLIIQCSLCGLDSKSIENNGFNFVGVDS